MTVACIGVMDGVHLGHQELLKKTYDVATIENKDSLAITFFPHPAKVLKPEATLWQLTTIEDRVQLIQDTGYVNGVEVIEFSLDMAVTEAENFIVETLQKTYGITAVVVGENFNFGKDRKGNAALMRNFGIEVFEVPLLTVDGDFVSSTRIRRLLIEGNIAEANKLLSRDHMVEGIVEHGDKRGRELGFPTANTAVIESLCLPKDGVYKGYVQIEGIVKKYKASISLGRRPTFYEERGLRLLEPHIIDFDQDIYGKRIKVYFEEFLRDQIKFNSIEDLITQIKKDVKYCSTSH